MNRFSMIALAGLAATSTLAMAQTTPGRTPMPTTTQAQPMAGEATTTTAATPAAATGTIADAAMANPKLSTLVSAVKAADLATTLSGPGPFTVFAPENEAFTRLAPGTLDTLLKPENKPTLTKVLTYHVVPGKVTLEQLRAQMKAGGGKATLTTVEGSPLTVTEEGAAIALVDASGNKSYVAQPDVMASNGVVHVVNGVVVPKLAPATSTSGS
ncbi:fasciclin domain-containing protein [Sphingomonas yantingensis]|uniref:Putative surface protein with fasciclin (FAS1) repeats n=1 Tax=Sphingomonas yantingensis TaxID=1241761 RepID=A0A7W9EKD5_9SPHN|nr:fasciclin domain-containing protein [Sphingomonas yantingensis]MBB5699915.1 putative surface protein with fasciclin (FAS1) repeats [Sphingomonas yantingensis]